MFLAAATIGSVDGLIWAGLAGLLLVAVIAGFYAGVLCAPALQERAVRRATRHVHRLLQISLKEFDRSSQLCQLLGTHAKVGFKDSDWQRLENSRLQMADAWKALADLQTRSVVQPVPSNQPFETNSLALPEWDRTPIETDTQLPDRTAFTGNLKKLLEASTERNQMNGLLLVRIDKCEQLLGRYGAAAVASLQSRVASVLIKAIRDEDLVCRLGSDQFGILLPGVNALAGVRLAESIRSAVRDHAFRLEASGPAVLVTASFGYAACLPCDSADLTIDRAEDALSKSQSTGRNQLHVHDANSRILVHVS